MFDRLIFAVAASPALAGCATAGRDAPADTADSQARSCFFLSQVNGFNDAADNENGSDRIIVNVSVNDKYLFETFGSCPDLNWSQTIGFDQRGQARFAGAWMSISLSPPRLAHNAVPCA